MTLPESVVVGPVTYRITSRDEDWYAYEQDGGGRQRNNYGATWPARATLLLNPNNPDQIQRVTVLHELLHAVSLTAGHRGGKLTEERWVSMVDSLLLDTLVRNPDLAAWLLESGP
jgi:hypothetical protein